MKATILTILLLSNCFDGTQDSRHCIDELLPRYAAKKDIATLLSELEDAMAENTEIEQQCHPIVHAIGRLAFKRGGLADAFHRCRATCQSGCYHGAIERMFEGEHLPLQDLIAKVPESCGGLTVQSLKFQCAHGVGHALLYEGGYNIAEALRGCDTFEETLHERSCAIGVFMENIIGDRKEERLHRDDPLHPCPLIPEKYRGECFKQITKTMHWLGMRDEEMAAKCFEVPWKYRAICFEAFGRDLTQSVRSGHPERMTHACEVLSGRYDGSCIGGAAWVLIDFTGNTTYAFPFCNALTKEKNRRDCYRSSLSYLSSMYEMDAAKLRTQCEEFAGDGRSLCQKSTERMTQSALITILQSIIEDWQAILTLDF